MTSMKTFLAPKLQQKIRGFVMPLTLIICVIILTIATGISIILTKELYFSKLSRLSQLAYYAADNGLMCATMIDDQYVDPVTGLGIFQYANSPTSQAVLDGVNTSRATQGLSPLTLNSIKCATSDIFNASVTGFAVTPFSRTDSGGNIDNGKTTTFNMRMDIGNSEARCATIVVNKTPSYRQIISRGFASCTTVYAYPIERAIVSTSESSGGIATSTIPVGVSQAEYTTPGTYTWIVPAGVTSVSAVVIGGGGAGGAAATGGSGGGGGGLAYRNAISVNPGDVVTVQVGAGGAGVVAGNGNNGGDSYFKDTAIVKGQGGTGGKGGGASSAYLGGNGGGFTGTNGGNGGNGGDSKNESSGGGGGAGGYSGAGGKGGTNYTATPGASGTGGSAAGGNSSDIFGMFSTNDSAQSGGGVGIYGSGISGSSPRAGGSGGTNGNLSSTSCSASNTGGVFGGGGGGQGDGSLSHPGCSGGGGAVRIIWPGDVRQFPSTRTANE